MAAVVVDTNVVAYHLLGVEEHRDLLSRLFLSHLEFVAPDSLKAEILNVLWLTVRNGVVTLDFVAAAEREGLKLLTYDRRPRDAFPETSLDPATILASR